MTAVSSETPLSTTASGTPPPQRTLAQEVRTRSVQRWKQRNLILGGSLILLLVLIALFAQFIAPYGPQDTDYTARLAPPGAGHLFGTDNLGRDIFSRVIWGAQIDLQVGIISVIPPFIIGVFLGCLTGYYGGRLDTIVMRITDVIQAFPFLILIIAIVAVLGTGLTSV